MFHGRSVFGDSVTVPDPTKSRPIQRVSTNGLVPVVATIGTRLPVTNIRERTVSMPVPQSYPGQRVGYGPAAPLTEYMTRTTPIGPPRPVHEAIGPWMEVPEAPMRANGAPLEQRMLERDAGIFHRPPTVGGARYRPPHTFGVPVFSGFQGTPDGLGGIRGYR